MGFSFGVVLHWVALVISFFSNLVTFNTFAGFGKLGGGRGPEIAEGAHRFAGRTPRSMFHAMLRKLGVSRLLRSPAMAA